MGRKAGVGSDDTRRELLAATMKVLVERGYEGARVSEIAREAGITTGAIYNHFSSKAELLTAAITEQGPHLISGLLASGAQVSVLDTLRTIGATLPDRPRPKAPVLLELVSTATRDPEVARVVSSEMADGERDLSDVIRLAQEHGEIDTALDPEAFARFAHMLSLGSMVIAAVGAKPIDHDAWTALIDRTLEAARPQKNKNACQKNDNAQPSRNDRRKP
jgi:AcrR family transcriptional regulator